MNINDIVHDFTRRYADTYVLVKFPGDESENVFHVDQVAADDDHGAVLQLSSNEYGSIKLNLATGHEILFRYPEVDTFQHGKDSHYFRRVPARQYRRGLCNANAGFYLCTTNAGVFEPPRWDWELVNSAYHPRKYAFDKAIEMLVSGKYRSVALDKKGFSISLSLTAESSYMVFYFELCIGRYNPNTKDITVIENAFHATLKELCNG